MRTTAVTVGLVLAALLGASDIAFVGASTPAPAAVVALGAALGVITLIGVVLAWRGGRGQRGGLWAVIITRALSALSSVPGLLVSDTSAGIKAGIAVGLVAAAVAVVLLAPGLRREPARTAT